MFSFAGRKTELEATCVGIIYRHLWIPLFLSWRLMKAAGKCMPYLFEQLLHSARLNSVFIILQKKTFTKCTMVSEARNKIWRYFAVNPFEKLSYRPTRLAFICEIR